MVSVSLVRLSNRKSWYAQYRCPVSGKKVRRSTGETVRRKAERFATNWELQLAEGGGAGCTWQRFRERYSDEFLIEKRQSTISHYESVLDQLEAFSTPLRLEYVDASFISKWRTSLISSGKSDATRATYLRALKTALTWAKKIGLITKVPEFPREKRSDANTHRGRALTDDELKLLISKVPEVVPDKEQSRGYQRLLAALHLSGLRISESQSVSWDDDRLIRVDLDGKYPVMHFPGHLQKNGKSQTVAITPDFSEWLKETPKKQRTGLVLTVPMAKHYAKNPGDVVGKRRIAKTIIRIGKATGIKTSDKGSTPTAHDLRRTFATRWSTRVLPSVLKSLCRHSTIATTMGYYVQSEAYSIGEQLANLDWGDK